MCFKQAINIFDFPVKAHIINPVTSLLLARGKLLVDHPDLLLDIDGLSEPKRRLWLWLRLRLRAGDFALGLVRHARLFPPRELLLRQRLAGEMVKDVAALAGEPLEVVGHVDGGEVGSRGAGVGFCLLVFPVGVEQLN